MNPGRSADTMTCLPSASESSRIADFGLVGRVATADEFDQRHDRDRTEEMHADEPGATFPRDRLGQPMDRDRRRVRGEDGGFGRHAIELAPQGRLDGEVLEDGFDDEIGVGRVGDIRRGPDPGEGRITVLGGEPALRHGSIEVGRRSLPDPPQPAPGPARTAPPPARSPRGPGRSRGPSTRRQPRRPVRSSCRKRSHSEADRLADPPNSLGSLLLHRTPGRRRFVHRHRRDPIDAAARYCTPPNRRLSSIGACVFHADTRRRRPVTR